MILFALCPHLAHAQAPIYYPQGYCLPGTVPQYVPLRTTPLQTLLFVRLDGPEGMKITFYRGSNQSDTLDAPLVVGLRPGYFYRIALSHMKSFPEQIFYPTLEVRGSLLLASSLRACDYPAGLLFKEEDFTQVRDGSLLKKVIFVEKVARAIPQTSSPEKPFEIVLPRGKDPLAEARERGLPVMIVEMGQRKMEVQELLCAAISGTILLPGDAYLPLPGRIPCLPWSCYPLYDPILGPAPWLYYTLPDGGDWGSPAALRRDGYLVGLDPADTIAQYKNSRGQDKIAVSNRVCLCIPRFVVARGPLGPPPSALESSTAIGRKEQIVRKIDIVALRTPRGQQQEQHLELVKEEKRPSAVQRTLGTIVTGKIVNLDLKVGVTALAKFIGTPAPTEKPPELGIDVPLKVDKWPDCCGGVVGSIITFFIRYTNRGTAPISDVIVMDSLITRFEYVKDSAKTSRAATFTVQPNEVGSSIVRWEIKGVLRPGESGTVSFQVRIR